MAYEDERGSGRALGRILALGTVLAWIAAACAAGGGDGSGDDGGPTSTGPGGGVGTGGMGTGGAGTGTGVGGMGTGGMGAGAMCSEDPCKLVAPQCGCPTGEKCTWNAGVRSCAPDGDVGEGESCGNCQAGMLCVGFPGANTCKRFCNTDNDCPAGPGSICVLEINDPNDVPYPQMWCSDNCDPVTGTGCPATAGCELLRTETSPWFTVCEGAGSGTQGASCTDFQDCAPGYGCFQDPNTLMNFCLRYTNVDSPQCPNGTTLAELNPPAVIGTVTYGVCF